MKVTPPRWNLTTGIKYVNYIFFHTNRPTTPQPHRRHIGHHPHRGFPSQVFVTHSASLANKAGEQDYPWGCGPTALTGPTNGCGWPGVGVLLQPPSPSSWGDWATDQTTGTDEVGLGWQVVKLSISSLRVLSNAWLDMGLSKTVEYPKKLGFFNGTRWYFSGIGDIVFSNQSHIFGKGVDDLFFQPASERPSWWRRLPDTLKGLKTFPLFLTILVRSWRGDGVISSGGSGGPLWLEIGDPQNPLGSSR